MIMYVGGLTCIQAEDLQPSFQVALVCTSVYVFIVIPTCAYLLSLGNLSTNIGSIFKEKETEFAVSLGASCIGPPAVSLVPNKKKKTLLG